MKKFSIKDLAEGECAVHNNGTLGELRKVLSLAFPNNYGKTIGINKYYFACNNLVAWTSSDNSPLPIQSVKDFLTEEFTYGEEVEVRDFSQQNWMSRIYIGKNPTNQGFIVVNSNGFAITWKQIRKPQPKVMEVTMDEVAAKFDVPVEQLKIKK